jgi:hypothetical protein
MHILLSSLVFLLICAFVQLEVQINLVPMRRLTPNTPDTFFRVSQRKGVLFFLLSTWGGRSPPDFCISYWL